MSKRSFSRFLYSGMVIVVGVVLAATLGGVRAAQRKSGAVRVGNADIGGVVTQPQGARGGRLGDRGNHRPADQIRQDRRHRRSGTLPGAGSSQGELQTCGFAATGWWIRRRSKPRRARP